MADFVTIEDTNEPECETCGHVTGYHGNTGCHFNICDCIRTHRQVRAAHIERIVRREIARELDRIGAADSVECIERDHPTPIGFIAVPIAVIEDRAKEIAPDAD